MNHHDGQHDEETEKKLQLFRRQKETLDAFLRRGAISQAQYDKSLGDLKLKMGIESLLASGSIQD